MEPFIVSARKYRPTTFKSVVGQEALTTTLKNAIAGNKLAHAYLFSGPRGVGKTTCARIFAKTINCLNPAPDHEACNACESCVAFNEQRSYNIHELDAASNNGVDDIRSLIDQVRVPPQIGKYKVYIIDEVHMLSQAAFNSFLKTLEEPPAHALFILATTEKQKIIPTILSRCQVYDFNRIRVSDIVAHLQHVALQEGVKAEPEALNVIAQKADGGMRDALSIFDQTVSYTGGNVTYQSVIENLNVLDYEYYFRLSDAILEGNVVDALLILNYILNRGFEGQYIISGIASHFRDLLVSKDPATAQLLQMGASIRERYAVTAQRCPTEFLYQAIELANECDLNYRLSKNRRLLLELTLIKLCQLTGGTTPHKEEMKRGLEPIAISTETKTTASSPEVVRSDSKPGTTVPEKKAIIEEVKVVKAEPKNVDNEPKAEDELKVVVDEPEVVPTRQGSGVAKKKSLLDTQMGLSLTSLVNENSEKGEAMIGNENGDISTGKGNNRFTEQQLVTAWKAYAEQLDKEKLLKNTMSLYLPTMKGDTLFEVAVNTELNKQYITDNSASILAFLREQLKNDDVSMTITIAEGEAVIRPATPRDIFNDMAEQNPSLQKLSDEFGLELS
ncbi:MAG TPA: DNA polymerase III subunit gamma/tau [Bacteroidales bacterium]|jgi:DNA polymerase-3 subunit gamma/tau|nr:DNA polymerase III subunit gamma/tau [Bacteroidales bacterium]